jgi:hypothetical protein
MIMRTRSTTSVEMIEIMLNLALSTPDIPQIRKGAIQIVRLVATPDVCLMALHQRKPKKTHTVDAGSEICEPCTAGNGDYDFITLPNCHAERAAVSQKGT